MAARTIIHVANIELLPTTGMGRIACEWRAAAQRKGINFVHIGPKEVAPVPHRLIFPLKARKLADKLATEGTVILIHEPCAWAFRGMRYPKVGFSHGVEPRGAEIEWTFESKSLKRRITGPILRWLDFRGLRAMDTLLVSNSDDQQYLVDHQISTQERIHVFRNGIDSGPVASADTALSQREQTIVFNGTWLPRKGIHVLVKAAVQLAARGVHPHWLVMGTSKSEKEVLSDWPEDLRPNVTVIPHFPRKDEKSLLARGEVFVLPSYFEGQPLALVQAMAAGLCCITSNCCGQKDIIKHGDNGFLFDPGDDMKLTDLIQKVLGNESMRRQVAMQSIRSVSSYDWNTVADEVMERVRNASF